MIRRADIVPGDRMPGDPVAVVQVVFCPHCKTMIRIGANEVARTCPNPTCNARITIANPNFTRGGA